MNQSLTLEQHRQEFSQRRLIATPIAGTVAWIVIAIGSQLLSPYGASMLLFAATGSIIYLAMFVSKLTGEDFLDKNKPKNPFDGLFMCTVAMILLGYSIVIPFYMVEPSSLALSVGILSGIIWVPISWIIQHWIGWAHAVARTVAVVAAWFLFPEDRMLAISVVIVVLYLWAIAVLNSRWKALQAATGTRAVSTE